MAENIQTSQAGKPTTVTSVAEATGGINAGHFIETDIDEDLFRFNSDDTPLMNLMLKAKKVKIASPEVDHYMIQEQVCEMTTVEKIPGDLKMSSPLPLEAKYQNIPRPHATLLVLDVNGYADDGVTRTPGQPLMLFVTGTDAVSGNPVVRAVNGSKDNPNSDFSLIPGIPAGSRVVLLANALYETQKHVDPDLIVPVPTRVYCQKRGMNHVVSDYFNAQKKRIPFTDAIIAETMISEFKRKGNRTLWAGRKGRFKMSVPKMGLQYVYTTEGIRWQFKREMQTTGPWTFEKFLAMAKMFYTGEDVPKSALLLAGKNLLEQIQKIDFSKHPEVTMDLVTNKSVGWEVTRIHTVFGDIEIKREPTLDKLGWSNSGALIGEDRLVHYIYSAEHSFQEGVEGEEAKRSGMLIWDALALKGGCHLWIDGGETELNAGAEQIQLWDSAEKPEEDEESPTIYYLVQDCPAIDEKAKAGQMWKYGPGKEGNAWMRVS